MMQRHGPNQLKSAIEHDYLHKRYEKALDGALRYIELANTKDCKVSSTREMSEIAIHCALHLNRIDLAEQLTDTKQVCALKCVWMNGKLTIMSMYRYPWRLVAFS